VIDEDVHALQIRYFRADDLKLRLSERVTQQQSVNNCNLGNLNPIFVSIMPSLVVTGQMLGIRQYRHVQNDDVRWTTKQPHLSAIVQHGVSPCLHEF